MKHDIGGVFFIRIAIGWAKFQHKRLRKLGRWPHWRRSPSPILDYYAPRFNLESGRLCFFSGNYQSMVVGLLRRTLA
ncbi:hypothetical protein Hanom_Chr17g01548021 [Helianthus anomalus]